MTACCLVSAASASWALASAHSPAPRGALQILTGRGGCLGTGKGCGRLRGPTALVRIAISPDGRNLYLTGQSGGLAVIRRNNHSGRLRQLSGYAGCFRRDGHQVCAKLSLLRTPGAVTVSPDGHSVYVTTAHGILAFARNRHTGGLRLLTGTAGCVDAQQSSCGPLRGLSAPTELQSAGNGTLYAAGSISDAQGSTFGALAVFRRDPATGALTQLPGPTGCVNGAGLQGCSTAPCLHALIELALSHGGTHLYTGSTDSLDPEATSPGAVATFARAPATGVLAFVGCAQRNAAISDLLPAPGGDSVFVATLFGNRGTGRASASIDLYKPAGPSGTMVRRKRLACLEFGHCQVQLDIDTSKLAIAPHGKTLYDAIFFSGVAALRVGKSKLTPLRGRWGCLAGRPHFMPPKRCARAGQEIGADAVVSPDGRYLYVGTLGNGSGSFYAGGIETFAIHR